MKILALFIILVSFTVIASIAQEGSVQISGKEVCKNEDVVFHQIDEHTWVGTGHMMYNESAKSQWGGLVVSAYGVNINYSETVVK